MIYYPLFAILFYFKLVCSSKCFRLVALHECTCNAPCNARKFKIIKKNKGEKSTVHGHGKQTISHKIFKVLD